MAELHYVTEGYVTKGYYQTGVTIDWGTKVIFIPTFVMTLTQTVPSKIYDLDLDVFRLELKRLEATTNGMAFPRTHTHETTTIIDGTEYARKIIIINDYTVTFEELSEPYRVNAIKANSNISTRQNVNSVSLSTANSAGLQGVDNLIEAIASTLTTAKFMALK